MGPRITKNIADYFCCAFQFFMLSLLESSFTLLSGEKNSINSITRGQSVAFKNDKPPWAST